MIYRKMLKYCHVIFWAFFAFSSSALTREQIQTLEKMAQEFNKVTTVQAQFVQTTSRGVGASGRFLMKRPGKMRMQYDRPINDAALIVNSGVTLWLESGRKRNVPTGQTPLKAMVQKDFTFFDKNIEILAYEEEGDDVQLTMQWKPRPQDGYMTMTMSKNKPVTIKGWSIIDSKGFVIDIRLWDIQFGVEAPSKYFRVNNPVDWKP